MAKKCINAHDRCNETCNYGCPYCEEEFPPRDDNGRFVRYKTYEEKQRRYDHG